MTEQNSIRILLVEDNEINQLVMQKVLLQQGYDLHIENNGEEALVALQKGRYDLVIMDCMMPVMDGFTATRTIRRGTYAAIDPNIPILALTGLSGPGDKEKCLDAGMNAFIMKPIKAGELYAGMAALLDGQAPANASASMEKFSAIIDSMFDVLVRDTEQWQIQLQAFCKAGAYAELGALAHKIRGTADLIGERELSGYAAELEMQIRVGDTGSAPVLAGKVLSALAEMIDDVKARATP